MDTNMNLHSLAEAIHEATGATGEQLTQDTLVAAAVLAGAFGLHDAGKHFADRALSYGPLGFIPSEPKVSITPAPGWNFGTGFSGVVE